MTVETSDEILIIQNGTGEKLCYQDGDGLNLKMAIQDLAGGVVAAAGHVRHG